MLELNKIYCGDCLELMKQIPDNSIDSIVTDPPYELGFMGKSWDSTGIANNVDLWRECLRVLKPGGHLLSFSGTRTYHRMASAIKDAGFEVRDMIEWCYGSGFPKSLNIGKAVDKIHGNDREEVPNNRHGGGSSNIFPERNNFTTTKGISEREGRGTALKPAHEPICMARKPLSEKTVAENCLKWGTGGINIDESRVETEDNTSRKVNTAGHFSSEEIEQRVNGGSELGRFPANLILDNSEEVRECFPNESERFFKSILYYPKASKSERNKGCEELEEKQMDTDGEGRNQAGFNSADRKPMLPRANNHPTVKPIALMEYLIKMVTKEGGIVLDPFAGSGTTLVAAKKNGYQYIGCELTEEYIPIIEARLNATEEEVIDELPQYVSLF